MLLWTVKVTPLRRNTDREMLANKFKMIVLDQSIFVVACRLLKFICTVSFLILEQKSSVENVETYIAFYLRFRDLNIAK